MAGKDKAAMNKVFCRAAAAASRRPKCSGDGDVMGSVVRKEGGRCGDE
jgi:hypothetical protein